MSGAEKLYTPELLALTLQLAQYPWDDTLPLKGDARSKSCGSTMALGMSLDATGVIDGLGMKVQACAVGQASAALFAASTPGTTPERIRLSFEALTHWLAGDAPLPDWPGLDAIAAARAFPGRHGAIILPWQAALAALSSEQA